MKTPLFLCVILILANLALFGQNNPAPSVIQLVPVSAKPGSGGFTLTVYGANFVAGSVLNWNGTPRATQVVSSDQLTATISAQDISKATTASVAVVNPAPGGGASNVAYFPVQLPSATIAVAPGLQALEPGLVAVGDFNGDGKLDLVIGQGCTSIGCIASLDFYAGRGDGSFSAPIRTPVNLSEIGDGQTYLRSLFVADFNADGKPDIAFNSWTGDSEIADFGTIMLGNGDGTFTQIGGPITGSYQDDVVAVGDLNGDGLPDLIAMGPGGMGSGLEGSIWLANANGTYTGTEEFGFGYVLGGGAALGDFNGDGKLDVAFASESSVGVWLGNGGGSFENFSNYQTTGLPTNVFAVDLNGDGKLDLVTNDICVLFGNGDGTFNFGPCTNAAKGPMVLGDFNTDGKPDIAILAGNPPAINVYFGQGDGTFSSPLVYELPTSPVYSVPGGLGEDVVALSPGDFRNDGRAGFAVSGTPTAAVYEQTVASVTPTAVAFGTVELFGTNPSQTVTFHNIKASRLQITGIKIIGIDAGAFSQTNNCGKSLPGGGSCQIQVTFTPRAGGNSAYLTVDYQGIGQQQTVPLSGIGIGPTAAPGQK
jgi:FG-GAP-like repeat/IPT/TIG domain